MGQEMHLNDLMEPDSDFMYQGVWKDQFWCRQYTTFDVFIVVMHFHDIADIVKKKMKSGASIFTTANKELIKKCCKYIEESMLFVCEFVEKCDKDTETSGIKSILTCSWHPLATLGYGTVHQLLLHETSVVC